jgi:peptidoglycan/xylan/chitin deacetylase (PgdA/CDA1 family)
MKLTVLMYHAIADERGHCPGADAHYSVSADTFASHVRRVGESGRRCISVAKLLEEESRPDDCVALTFDDGHASNLSAAALLAQSGGSADFFVNPSTVGTPHFLSWGALREMADSGMSIQSHGMRHRYLDELAPPEVKAELVDSKRAIEDRLARPVTVFAPPGGRLSPGLARIAFEAGYAAICTSRVALWRRGADVWDIPRLAVLHTTTEAQFDRWIRQDRAEIIARRARYLLLTGAKRLLGNRGYESLRQGLLRTPDPTTSR